ncbi:unnamed protein product [Cyprideis torosa]|uniref:Uncharacterized protein n=1 Tax=Cyprideis torosa TaxID=163714 RepID=A0A7R8WED1_9CRUS|nr:unnamed protein product [Cyprideis torosa]CAG0895646.1 unnamed protein product [Cyprideis torosa]
MTFLQWRRFNFFDVAKEPTVSDPALTEQLKKLSLTCSDSGRGQLVFGDINGFIYFINRQLEMSAFRAYQLRVTNIVVMQQSAVIVTLGEDEAGINPLLKTWNLEKPSTSKDGSPLCTRISRVIPPGNRPTPATAVAVHESLTLMAIGFEDGSVMLYRGDAMREKGSKKRLLHHTSGQSITGLFFQTTPKSTVLFIVSTDGVWSVLVSGRNPKDELEKIEIDSIGAPSTCIALADGRYEHHLILGKRDAVYCYTPDSRGPCYAFEGDKVILRYFRGYLVIVSKDLRPTPPAGTAFNPTAGVSTASHILAEEKKPLVTIYDLQNKLIAFSAPFPEEISQVVAEWGDLFLLTVSGKLMKLSEKDVRSKLELLFKKNLYDVAIKLAKSQHYDAEGLMEIFRLYGDHLYSKGDYSGAIQQYIKAIGRLEAAYVIRKFLDSQRIQELTAYLQSLHKQGYANEDHTTLLLNCYTKLRDTQKLDQFIMSEGREVDFDVGIAIRVCRQSGYYKHALALARKHHRHSEYLKIQLDDHKDYSDALEYIARLDFEEAENALKKYGAILMREEEDRTTEVLKSLCTDYRPMASSMSEPLPAGRIDRSSPAEYLNLFVGHAEKLKEFLEYIINHSPTSVLKSSRVLVTTLLELYLHESDQPSDAKILEFLRQYWKELDLEQAYLLCQSRGFYPGVLFLYEKAELFREIIAFHAEKREFNSVLACCQKFTSRDSHVWMIALEELSKHCTAVPVSVYSQLLTEIHKRKLSSPLLVLEALRNSSITLGTLKEYLFNALQAEESSIEECERLSEQYNRETAEMRDEIRRLQEKPTVFQGSKCNACNNVLDLPSVHFLCKHSFHQHCFESYTEAENECPACAPENRKIQEIIRKQEGVVNLNDAFFDQLERAEDPFGVVADYFGRSVFKDATSVADTMITRQMRKETGKVEGGVVPPYLSHSANRSEGAMRSAEIPSAPMSVPKAEGRLRAEERRTTERKNVKTEARVRNEESSGASFRAPTEGQVRAAERRGQPVLGPEPAIGRLIIDAMQPSETSIKPKPSSPQYRRRRSPSPPPPATLSPTNPFSDGYDESKNPFADESTNGTGNNVVTETPTQNPFSGTEDMKDDYDATLNPFGES